MTLENCSARRELERPAFASPRQARGAGSDQIAVRRCASASHKEDSILTEVNDNFTAGRGTIAALALCIPLAFAACAAHGTKPFGYAPNEHWKPVPDVAWNAFPSVSEIIRNGTVRVP